MPKKGESLNRADFFVVGSSTLDIIAKTSDVERIDIGGRHVERLVCISFASKSELESLELSPGGSASNSAIMMRTLGSSVCLLSAVGNDEFGKAVLADLRKNRINTAAVKVFSNSPTGVGLGIISPGGEKSILVYRGANSALGRSDVPESAIKNSKRILITSLVSAKNYGLFKKVLALAKKHRRPVVFAPSITMLHSWMPQLRKLRPHFDVVIMNYEEGRYYTGKDNIRDILGSLPGKIAVVTKDVEGAYAADKSGKSSKNAKYFHVSAVPVKIKDTTGAGDAFSGAFAHTYYPAHSITDALKTAAAAAALKLTHKGAHFSLGKAHLASFMKSNASKLVVRRF
ncbi:carbohydrate kinase family protein [Candidatus Woesearchaeota archaeon]|nr:carbohydrate kinase family protein [Candidatus Woesearchaeota archaeon]